MHKVKLFSGLLLTIVVSSLAHADFQQRVLEEITAGHAYPCASAPCPTPDEVSQAQFIFVDGFLGRPTGHNFIPLETVLKTQFGIGDYLRILPSSAKSIATNAPL